MSMQDYCTNTDTSESGHFDRNCDDDHSSLNDCSSIEEGEGNDLEDKNSCDEDFSENCSECDNSDMKLMIILTMVIIPG